MGEQKVNHHKRTRFNDKNGFREALCPVCGRWVYVMSYEDDTRWRYGQHRPVPGATLGPLCAGARELLPAPPPGT